MFVWNKHHKSGNALETVLWKSSCTTAILLMALVGLVDAHADLWRVLLISGLLFGLVGDIVICRPDGFAAGMISFALGHLCYIAGLLSLGTPPLQALPVFAAVYAVLLFIAFRMREGLGTLFLPTLVYAAVLTAMLALTAAAALSFKEGWVLLMGGALFFVSDLLLITGIVTKNKSLPRDVVSQYCYFFGQSLFAVSVYIAVR